VSFVEFLTNLCQEPSRSR